MSDHADITRGDIERPDDVRDHGRLVQIIRVLRDELSIAGRIILEQRREIHTLRRELRQCTQQHGSQGAKHLRIMFGNPTKRS